VQLVKTADTDKEKMGNEEKPYRWIQPQLPVRSGIYDNNIIK